MSRYILLAVDVALILLATLMAFALRENLDVAEDRFVAFLPYLCATAVVSLVLVPVTGLNRSIWRFSGMHDYLSVTGTLTAICAGAVALSFVYNRLDGVARSLPFLQAIAGTMVLVGARVLHQMRHAGRKRRKGFVAQIEGRKESHEVNVLIVGVTHLAETYIQALAELDAGRISVAGLAGQANRYVGRLVDSYLVLGLPEEIEAILDNLELHGVIVDRIVVAVPFAELAQEAQEALLRAERLRSVPLQFLTEILGFDTDGREERAATARSCASPLPAQLDFEIDSTELEAFSERLFWKAKRGLDALTALILLAVLSPLFVLVALCVAACIGFPVVFWQQRPGLKGRTFRLYKFRTMGPAHGPDGRRLSDAERMSRWGVFLRRTKLDELPQLLNIARGDMSFVGPRPLLPKDQPKACKARLLVRPGLTGWAQVVGGRAISPEDKAALDVWYVRNASLLLDLEIVLRTVPIVLVGEGISEPLTERAWRDLIASGIAKAVLTSRIKSLELNRSLI